MKYRIRMDGNGNFIIQRKRGLFWKSLRVRHHKTWAAFGRDPQEWLKALELHWQDTYKLASHIPEVAQAVAVLGEVKCRDLAVANARKFTTIVKEVL